MEKWESLPLYMQNTEVRRYYEILSRKRASLIIKRSFDIICSLFLLFVLSPVMLVTAVIIKLDSDGRIFFRQTRVTRYGKKFKILKFRTMVEGAASMGPSVTSFQDARITRVGNIIRKLRIDEFPQLINVLIGDMSFVGTRPEVPEYVQKYKSEMYATLLLPAGVTSITCVKFKDEDQILDKYQSTVDAYINVVLPRKMKLDLQYIKNFNFFYDLKIMFMTVIAVLGIKR